MYRLTIITPTLNQAAFIERTLMSVVSQLGPNDAFVVVDGGSTDGTHQILERWSAKITAVHIREGCSQAEALAWGFENYPADYACYLNSDDVFMPDALTAALDRLSQAPPRVVACYSNRIFVDAADQITGLWALPPHSNYFMQRWDYIPQETCFWRYSAMMACGGIDPALKFAVDYDLFARMMNKGDFERINSYWATFRVHAQSKTQTINDSVGKTEVAQIQQRHGIKTQPWDRALGFGLRVLVEQRSRGALSDARLQFLQERLDSQISTPPDETRKV